MPITAIHVMLGWPAPRQDRGQKSAQLAGPASRLAQEDSSQLKQSSSYSPASSPSASGCCSSWHRCSPCSSCKARCSRVCGLEQQASQVSSRTFWPHSLLAPSWPLSLSAHHLSIIIVSSWVQGGPFHHLLVLANSGQGGSDLLKRDLAHLTQRSEALIPLQSR